MSFLLRLTSGLLGRRVGTDRFGNIYYESRRPRAAHARHKRWVVYAGEVEATSVPPEWHGWLHHTTDALPEGHRYPWQKEYEPNATGTPHAYRPAGHDYAGGQRRVTTGDYEAWTPGQ
jgi:NADH:ubiquinone oxidoreductase subunit